MSWRLLLLLFPVALAAAADPAGERAFVRHVVDGDTLILADERHVRLIGINTPELGRKERPEQPLAREAQQMLRSLVQDRPVQLHYGQDRHDRHGRTLAWVETAGGEDVQARLLSQGLGWYIAIPDNLARLAHYRRLEQTARAAGLGVWSHPAYKEALPANTLSWKQKGFQRVRGRITALHRGKKHIYLRMNEDFAIQIPRADWNRYFTGEPDQYRDKMVVVRGWTTVRQDGRMQVRIQHPAMIETLNPDRARQ